MWCVPNLWNLLYLHMSFFPLLYQHLMHSAPWSDSISATNAPGTTSTFLCFQLPTQVLQAFQSANPYPASLNDMVSHGDHVGLPKTFTKLKITMKVKWMLSKSGARANGPYRTVTLYMLESHGPPGKKPNMENLYSLHCAPVPPKPTCDAWPLPFKFPPLPAMLVRKMIALTIVTFGKITHVWLCMKKCIRYYRYVSWMLLPAYTVFVCVCVRGCRHFVDPCSWAIDDRSI